MPLTQHTACRCGDPLSAHDLPAYVCHACTRCKRFWRADKTGPIEAKVFVSVMLAVVLGMGWIVVQVGLALVRHFAG